MDNELTGSNYTLFNYGASVDLEECQDTWFSVAHWGSEDIKTFVFVILLP